MVDCDCLKDNKFIACPECCVDCRRIGCKILYRNNYQNSSKRTIYYILENERGNFVINSWRSTSTSSRNDAMAFIKAEKERRVSDLKLRETSKTRSLSFLFSEWVKANTGKSKRRIRKFISTKNAYAGIQSFATVKASSLSQEDLLKMAYSRIRRSPQNRTNKEGRILSSTIAREFSVINAVYKWAILNSLTIQGSFKTPTERELIDSNLNEGILIDATTEASGVERPADDWIKEFLKKSKEVIPKLNRGETFSTNEITHRKRINTNTVCRGLLAGTLTISSGIRSQELAKLCFRDLLSLTTDKSGDIYIDVSRVKKNKKQVERYYLQRKEEEELAIQLFASLKRDIERRTGNPPEDNDLVFTNGTIETDQTIGRVGRDWRKAIDAINLRLETTSEKDGQSRAITITSLRHYNISNLIINGSTPHDVAESRGTSEAMIRHHYKDLFVEDIKKIHRRLRWE